MPDPGIIIKERYRIVRLIGKGGMGDVYEVVDELLGLTYALKQLKIDFESNPDILKRFQDEAKRMLRLVQMNHPNIVQVYHYDFERGFGRYLVMELIRGADLSQYVRARGRLPLPEVVRIGKAVASALGRAHDEGLVHRDVKPANILIDESDRKRALRPVVTDFGIAKDLAEAGDDTMTGTGVFIGTSRYAAPEQIRNERGVRIDHRADLYSLGAVLYEMYAGTRYLDELSPQQIMVSVGFDRDWRPTLRYPAPPPAAFAELVRQCLERDRDRRIASAAEVERLLEECLHEPTLRPSVAPAALAAPAAEPAPVPLAAAASPTAPTVIPEPEDSTAAVRRQAADRERARYAELIQGLRPEVDARLADWRRLIGELAAFNIVATDQQRLPDLDERLRAIEELQEQGELAATLANLEALNDRLGQARAEIVSALREVIAKAIADRRAEAQALREAAGDWMPAADRGRIDRLLRAAEDALTRNDWTACRAGLTDVAGLLARAPAAARAAAEPAVAQLLDDLRGAVREVQARDEDAGSRAAVEVDALATSVASDLDAGRLRAAAQRAQEALAAMRATVERLAQAERERLTSARRALDQFVHGADLATLQARAAEEVARAADAAARAAQAEQRGDLRRATGLYAEALVAYRAAQTRAAQQAARLLDSTRQQLADLVARTADAPPELVRDLRTAAEHALAAAATQTPGAAIEALQAARTQLATAFDDVALFTTAVERRERAAARRREIEALQPTRAQLAPIDAAVRDATAAFEARRWRQASEAYARAVALVDTLAHTVEQERQRAAAAATRKQFEAARAQLDLDAAGAVAADELTQATATEAAARGAFQRGEFGTAAQQYATAAAQFDAVRQRVAAHQAAQVERAQRDLAALLERAPAAPPVVMDAARAAAQRMLGAAPGENMAAHLTALERVRTALAAAAEEAPLATAAAAAQAHAQTAQRRVLELPLSRRQRREAVDVLRTADAAFEKRHWLPARDAYAQAVDTLTRLEAQRQAAPAAVRPTPVVWAAGGSVAVLVVAVAALWVLEVGPFVAPAPRQPAVAPVAPPLLAPKPPEAPPEAPPAAALARITASTPSADTVALRENDVQPFTIALTPADPLPPIRWLLDDREMARDAVAWEYRPDYDAAGAHTVRSVVADGRGDAQTRHWTVRVENVDRAPLLKGGRHKPGSTIEAQIGDTLLLAVVMEDPDGDPLTYAWQVDGKPAGSNKPELSVKVTGNHAVSVTATDGTHTTTGAWQVASAKLPPLKLDFTPKSLERLPFKQSQDFALVAPRDVPAASLTYAWTVDGRAVASDRTFRFVADDPTLVQGKPLTVRALARDQQGRTFSHEWALSIVPPAPAITGSTPAERTLDATDRQTFTLAAAPPVGNQRLSYVFEVDGRAATRGAQPGFTYTPSGEGDHTVTAYVEDNYQQRSRERIVWTIQASSIVAQAQAWLQEYEQALRRKDADTIARLRGLDAGALARLKKALQGQRELQVSLTGVKVERLDANRARASYQRVDTWVGPDGRAVSPQRQRCEHVFTFSAGRLQATTDCALTSGG